jgi:ubiquitin carboxyl-terminal hydrolase 14
MPKISVKWGTKLLDVDANLEDPPFILKAQLFDLTEIPPERQKLLIKVCNYHRKNKSVSKKFRGRP